MTGLVLKMVIEKQGQNIYLLFFLICCFVERILLQTETSHSFKDDCYNYDLLISVNFK